jgi:ubiquinone/menaquinone biosynthesis C-methylase UbiE
VTAGGRMTEAERLTTIVFGDTFALYDDEEFDDFLQPLYERLAANSIPTDVFRGARCLDAGCGGGRGSVLMAECGAAEVVGVDLSERNVETCRARAAQRGLEQCRFVQGSLLEVPFEDASFDVVWCNGVLHHTEDPDRALVELARVLKPGGRFWLYLYGSGGVYWFTIDWIRALLAGHDIRHCIYQLRLMSIPVRRIAEWIDDWFSPHLRRYTVGDVQQRLRELGFADAEALAGGTVYDTSQRLIGADQTEAELMGDGDVRFFCTKTQEPREQEHPLPDPPGGKGSPYTDGAAVTAFAEPLARVAAALEQVEARHGSEVGFYRVAACGSVHSKVRSLLETDAAFDTAAFGEHLSDLQAILTEFAHA